VPKPYEWGSVFGSVPESLAQVSVDHDGKAFGDRLENIMTNLFGLRAVPTTVLVPTELWANKNTFTGRPIVPESKMGLDPELQFTDADSLTARELGKRTGASPAQLDYAVRGFLGTLGVYGTMLTDQGLRLTGDYAAAPAATWRQMPVVKSFVHDPDGANSRYVTQFYDMLSRARQAEASYRAKQGDEAALYFSQHAQDIVNARAAESASRELAKVRAANQDIEASRDYTAEQKRQLMTQNNDLIRSIAKGISQAQK